MYRCPVDRPALAKLLSPWSVNALAGLVAAAGLLGTAHADNVPLSFSVSQTLQHDSNLLRRADDNDPESDTISGTGLRLNFDKSQGRQRYFADLNATINKYSNFSIYDNTSYDLGLGFSTEIGAKAQLALNAQATQDLIKFEDAGRANVEDKNLRDVQQFDGTLSYGLYGPLSVNVGLSMFKQTYDLSSSSFEDVDMRSVSAGLTYAPSDLLRFGVALRKSDSDIGFDSQIGRISGERDRQYVDFTTRYEVTGVSSLFARVSWTEQQRSYHAIRNTLDEDGWTGYINWNYRPRGRLTLNVSLTRDQGSNGQFQGESFTSTSQSENTTSTALSTRMGWELTSKVRLNLTYDYTKYKRERDLQQIFSILGITFPITENSESGNHYQAVGMSMTWVPRRWLQFGCGISGMKRTEDPTFNYNAFDATVYYCTGIFAINGMY